jgi:hypothetical protein
MLITCVSGEFIPRRDSLSCGVADAGVKGGNRVGVALVRGKLAGADQPKVTADLTLKPIFQP